MSSITDRLKSQFAKPIVVGAISYLAAGLTGEKFNVTLPLLGEVSKSTFYGLLGVGSSMGAEVLHNWVLPYLPQSDMAVQAENALLAPALSGAINIAAIQLIGSSGLAEASGYMEPFLLGAGSQIAGDYSFKYWIGPSLGMRQ